MAQDWARLAKAVRLRRTELHWSQDTVREAGGPSDVVLSRIERNEHDDAYPRADTIQKLDKGLLWQPGSAAAVLNGRDPVPLPLTTQQSNGVSDASTEDLLSELWRRIVPGSDSLAELALDEGEPGAGVSKFRGDLRRDVIRGHEASVLGREDDDQRGQGGL
jgi:hypothetical protein